MPDNLSPDQDFNQNYYWPGAVEGNFEDLEKGRIHYWTGEKLGRIAVCFSFENQPSEEAKMVFFIETDSEGWILRHISNFRMLDSEIKLIKNQSFKIQDDLEKRYRGLIDGFMKEREIKNVF